ncbi:MAG TPA: hypothetical protein VGC41_02735, partial [Kofleriaceae bacterium]
MAPVGKELWAVSPGFLTRLSLRTGEWIATDKLEYADPKGRFLVSATAPALPVWHADRPFLIRTDPVRTEVPGPPNSESAVIVPVADGRYLLWDKGQLRLWRSIGEAWRKPLGEPSTPVSDAQIVLDGRLFVLAQQRPPRAGEEFGELRISVAQVSDGAPHTQLRLPNVSFFSIAARRGFAAVRAADRVGIFDLRFGRWIRDLVLPPGVTEIAIDDTLNRVALGSATGLELVRPDALAPNAVEPEADESAPPAVEDEAPANGHTAKSTLVESSPEPSVVVDEANDIVDAAPAASDEEVESEEPLPDAPLVRLDPVAVIPNATPTEIAQSIDLRVQLVGARVHVAIAEAWDAGRIASANIQKPPFFDEVHGLLRLITGRAPGELSTAVNRQRATEDMTVAAERGRGGRLTPLDVLARDFQLSQIAVSILFTIVAPRLRGELARLYGILANDPGRPLVDEFLLGQILGAGHAQTIARELDGDRPLRRLGLVKVGNGDRPFASLTVDPLITRYITAQPVEGEPDQFMTLRHVDRDLEELQMPRAVIAKALRYLSTLRAKLAGDAAPGEDHRTDEPVRIVLRGRTGS